MACEVKHGRGSSRPSLELVAPPSGLASRWFAAIDPREEAAPPPVPRFPRHAVPLALLGVAALAFVKTLEVRASLGTGLLAAALVIVVHWLVARAAAKRAGQKPSATHARGLALEGERLAFLRGHGVTVPRAAAATDDVTEVLELDAPFGVTLLASPRRDRLIALLSSAGGTFYLGASFDAPARRVFAPLLDRCFTVVGDDAGMEAIGPDGEPLVLAPEELASLLDALVEHSPSCLDRFMLTDARGADITLDARQLRVGDRAVDLNAPLEWRPIVFQEAFGQAIAVYQGTWIRQSATELTLVSLLPALGPMPGPDLDLGSLDRTVLRDLRLMQATPEAPPPNEQRIAIDRLFMLPVRSALDRAPRASHRAEPARA